ncbi:hypothetical protein ACF0H5_000583 [Mactra antiquata]
MAGRQADWKNKLRQIIQKQHDIEDAASKEKLDDETDGAGYKRIRRLSQLIRSTGTGRGAINKSDIISIIMKLLATFLLCLSVVLVTSHLPRFPREHIIHLQSRGPFQEPFWPGSDRLFGFPNDIRQLMPFSRMNMPPRPFLGDWTNNIIPNGNGDLGPMFVNNADPWSIYQQLSGDVVPLNSGVNPINSGINPLNSGINPITDGTSTGLIDGPTVLPPGGQANTLSSGLNQWNALDSSARRFPVIPNPARPGGFVRPFVGSNGIGLPLSGTGLRNTQFGSRNTQFTGANSQFASNGFQSGVDPMSQNLGLRNTGNQFSWLK